MNYARNMFTPTMRSRRRITILEKSWYKYTHIWLQVYADSISPAQSEQA